MPDPQTISLLTNAVTGLATAIIALVSAIVYLYKRGERREKEHITIIKDLIHRNNILTERMEAVLYRVEELLKNWRAR